MPAVNENPYRSNNTVHGQGEFLNATLFDKANPPLLSKDGNHLTNGVPIADNDTIDGNGLGKKPSYIGNALVKVNNQTAQKFVNFSTLYNFSESGKNTISVETGVSNTWRPKFHDTPKVDVLAQQAASYSTHWGFMNTIANSKYIRVTNTNKTNSPFETLGFTGLYNPAATIENVGNRVRYCWIIPKTVRQAFNSRRALGSHLPSPNFFEQSANIDLKNQLKVVMIPAGATIIIQKKPLDAVIISNLISGHGGGTDTNRSFGGRLYNVNFKSNVIVEPIVVRNS